ncbi:MAG: hypothetical protein HQL39_05840, partial [Alphaproteobacteria bacterium]|nr:hypothetical protein [Alphaproteobacteria bacterium]
MPKRLMSVTLPSMAERAGATLSLPRVAEAARRMLGEAGGTLDADAVADSIAQALREDFDAALDVLSQRILDHLGKAYLETRRGAGRGQIELVKANAHCREIAAELLGEEHFFSKLARWIAVNVC